MISADRSDALRRPAVRLALVATVLATLVLGVATSAQAAPGPVVTAVTELDQMRAQVLADTNAARAAAGLAPLVESAPLDGVAQSCSQQQADANRMAHCDGLPVATRPAGRGRARTSRWATVRLTSCRRG